MTLTYTPDPVAWVRIPATAADDWAPEAAKALVAAQGTSATPEQLRGIERRLALAQTEAGEADARWAFLPDLDSDGIVVDLDLVDLGEDVPTDIDVAEESSGETEEFKAGLVHGKRTIWVSPDPAEKAQQIEPTDDALLAQVMYVGTVTGTGYLVTMRSGQHHLEQIVSSVPACEQLLATVQV